MKIHGKTFQGLEKLFAKELKNLGAEDISIDNRSVNFKGDKALLYKANYLSRLGIRFLVPLIEFKAKTKEDIYENAKQIKWHEIFNLRKTFAISANVFSDHFKHNKYPGLVVKDAIADSFRDKYGKRPNVGHEDPDVLINLHISGEDATISLDSSGISLFKRGYRVANHEAPINEVMASALIQLSGWDPKSVLLDPMCGSATIPIEAAMYSLEIPSGLLRQRYCFKNWEDFDAKSWTDLRENTLPLQHRTKINAADINADNVEIARRNIEKCNLSARVKLAQQDFFRYTPKYPKGTIIVNPPYGLRLKEKQINRFYEDIGEHLKASFKGYTAWIFSEKGEHLDHIELEAEQKISLFNGGVECLFQQFIIE